METNTEYIAIGANGVRVISEEEAKTNKKENIYYLKGVRTDLDYSNNQRAKDKDIVERDHFVIDLDIRNNSEGDVSDDEIIYEGEALAASLGETDEFFGEWSEIIFTGNGLHIMYRGTPTSFTPEEYKLGVKRIFRQWDKVMGIKHLKVDMACCNLARILRLPETVNQKNGANVFTIIKSDKKSRLFDLIKKLAAQEKKELKAKQDEQQKKLDAKLSTMGKDGNKLYEEINAIPAYMIAEKLLPEFPFNGKKNFKNKKQGFTGYFYNQETNTICNGGSRYFDWGNAESCWDNFQLVKRHYYSSNAQTFEFFKKILGKS